MEGKLVKDFNNYHLLIDGELYASTDNNVIGKQKLSLKSCETIKLGYDLDELAEEWCMKPENNWSNNNNEVGDNYGSYKEGFQKAVELLGDKKFTKNDILIAMICMQGQEVFYEKTFEETQETRKLYIENYIQSLQRAEWDVKVVMCCGLPDGCTEPEEQCPSHCEIVPLLDEDDCLILRRI